MELIEGIVVAIVISVAIEAVVGGFWHWMGSRELRKAVRSMDEGFKKMDERFAKMDERFAKMDERFTKMDERFAKMDERFAEMDKRFESLLKESSEAHTKILEAIRGTTRKRRKSETP